MGRWGLTVPLPNLPLRDHAELVAGAEAAGYTDLWSGETAGPDGFTPLALSAAWTERTRLGTGVVGVFTRGPALLAQQAAALSDASDGRFVLGHRRLLGPDRRGLEPDAVLEAADQDLETLDFLDAAFAGERTSTGFKLEKAPGRAGPGGARGAAGKDAAGWRSSEPPARSPTSSRWRGCRGSRNELAGAAEGFELLCRFFCLPGEREQIEPLARFMFASYITVPVYEAFFRWLGYGERIDPMVAAWKAKDREGAVAAAPWDVIEDTFVFGTPDQMRERLDTYVDGGITLPILTPITTPDRLGEMIEALAPE